MSNPYRTYEFQYITDLEQKKGISLDDGEFVTIRAVNSGRAWDEFKEWAKFSKESVGEVELIGSYQE